MAITIALAGNPNTGKTTLFNALTGNNQFVGNWPGVTVEKKAGRLKGSKEIEIVDLPGIYSLSPYTLEEVIARNYLIKEQPDVIIDIVDGTNLERNLYLATQLLEIGIPVVVAVNMMDIVQKEGDTIDIRELEQQLGCKVLAVSALRGSGIESLKQAAISLATPQRSSDAVAKQSCANRFFPAGLENRLTEIQKMLPTGMRTERQRFVAIKVFERDEKLSELIVANEKEAAANEQKEADGTSGGSSIKPDAIMALSEKAEPGIKAYELEQADDSESLIINGRYEHISHMIGRVLTQKNKKKASPSDKIDKVVTHRVLALPIFAVVMFLVFFISVTTVGGLVTDWANDGVFGDGWFLTGEPEAYADAAVEYEEAREAVEAFDAAAIDAGLDPESTGFLRAAEAGGIVGTVNAYADDTGLVEAVEITPAAYSEALAIEEPDPAAYGIWITGIPVLVEGLLLSMGTAEWAQSLVLDGIVAGVGAVLGFVPQMLVLFLLLALLEQCGYMARIAFILDRVFRRFGLSGKSFIPILIGTGCGVPGIMASRTIENQNDRRMTIMTTTFIPCSAKLPVIALFAGAIFGGAWWVAPSAYFLGIATILCSGIALKKTRFFADSVAPFLMELPAYHLPKISTVLRSMWERAWSFIKRAGTVILLASIVIWFISSYGFAADGFGPVESDSSLLAGLGSILAWLFVPLGFGNWEAAAASVSGLIAKENLVSTFAVLYGAEGNWYAALQASVGFAAAYALLAFNLLCAPCFAAIGAIRREMNNAKWTAAAIAYQCAVAWVVGLWIFQFAGLAVGEVGVNVFTFVAAGLLLVFLYLLFRPQRRQRVAVSANSKSAVHTA